MIYWRNIYTFSHKPVCQAFIFISLSKAKLGLKIAGSCKTLNIGSYGFFWAYNTVDGAILRHERT